MIESANFPMETERSRSYAAWAIMQPSVPGPLERLIARAMMRSESGGMAQLAILVCGASLAGLIMLALAVWRAAPGAGIQ